jgi:hypothetical protein
MPMKRSWTLVGLAAAAGVVAFGVGCEASGRANSEDSPGNCYVVVSPPGDGLGGPDKAVLGENSQCFDTKEQLYEAERQAGLQPPGEPPPG